MKWVGVSFVAVMLMSACMTPTSDTPEPDAPAQNEAERGLKTEQDVLDRVQDTCGLDAMKPYLGQQATAIPAAELPEDSRILAPDSIATMDYVVERLNILTDEGGMVIGLKCG